MDAEGKINWGDFDEEGDAPMIATGAGLIQHAPASNKTALNLVETFLLSSFRHSMRFRLLDTRRDVDDEYRALRVRHDINGIKARTFIWYWEENERF